MRITLIVLFNIPLLLVGQTCSGDLNDNGTVDGSDLLELLSIFGEVCSEEFDYLPVISEIYYNHSPAQGSYSDWEFIEIYNPHSVSLDLSGMRLSVNTLNQLASSTFLSPKRYLVLCTNIDSYNGELPNGTMFFSLNSEEDLNNSVELIQLISSSGHVLVDVEYSDYNGWSTKADGLGASLEWNGFEYDNSIPESLQASNNM